MPERLEVWSGVGAHDDDGMPSRFDVGDRVVAARGIGGLLRRRIRAGSPGVVIARGGDDCYAEAFGHNHTETVAGRDVSG